MKRSPLSPPFGGHGGRHPIDECPYCEIEAKLTAFEEAVGLLREYVYVNPDNSGRTIRFLGRIEVDGLVEVSQKTEKAT